MTKSDFPRPLDRAQAFADRLGVRIPILLAPMAGACLPSLSIAVANAGGMGACGALLLQPDAIRDWVAEFRAGSGGEFQINLWIPGPEPIRDPAAEDRQREFLASWGPPAPEIVQPVLPDFDAQCRAMLEARPRAISSIMGIYAPSFVVQMKRSGILWLATATTVAEARVAEAAGADAIIVQGVEAGGHRGSFRAEDAESQAVGLFSLLPQICDAVSIPVIAAGGISDARAIAAAIILGASSAMIGTGFLRSPEAKIHPAYAHRIGQTEAHQTRLTRAFTGRAGRAIRNEFVDAAAAPGAPPPAPYPIQRGFTRPMIQEALKSGNPERMQMWAGQSARFAEARPAAEIATQLWHGALALLNAAH
jgi:nitronate monooxygenase